jgi:hypothetical protein
LDFITSGLKGPRDQTSCVFGAALVFASIFLGFNYTEIGEDDIAKVFRIGRFLRLKYSSVAWKDVVSATVYSSGRFDVLNLKLVTIFNRRVLFTMPTRSKHADALQQADHQFPRSPEPLPK